METNFNFKSQVCTDKVQSERLLSLGLKKETADMAIEPDLESIYEVYYISAYPPSKRGIPAWSLHRLWELGNLKHIILDSKDEIPQIYEFVIDDIEKQIKEGYFKKEYLV